MSFQITRTETNVNSGNNKFKIVEVLRLPNSNAPPITNIYPIEIPIGQYSSDTLKTALNTKFLDSPQKKTLSNNNIDTDYYYTAAFDPTTNKITISHSRVFGAYEVVFGIQVEEGAAKLLGIAGTGTRGSGLIEAFPNTTSGNNRLEIIGRNAIDLAGIPYLILYLNDYERIIAPGSKAHKNFLVIPMEDHPVGTRFIISGDQKEKKGIYILTNNQKNIYEMRVTIRRPDGTLYDFKGTDHLLIFRVYRHDFRDFNS
jgi:hypothetical protein